MDDPPSQLESQAIACAKSRSMAIDFRKPLGFGTDGCVWKTNRNSAVKAFERDANYQRERDCYRRLKSQKVLRVGCFEIPRLRNCDDQLLVIEMGIVSPPFLLDFAKAYLDHPPDFDRNVMADWEDQQVEWFGERWPQIRSALYRLESIGIYYRDVRPGNIMFPEDT